MTPTKSDPGKEVSPPYLSRTRETEALSVLWGAPFLDNLSESGRDRFSWYVRCTVCEVQQIVDNISRAAAIAAWNRRSPPDSREREETIEECAKVADAFGQRASDELKTLNDYTRQSRVNFHSAAIVIAARIRALSSPRGKEEE